MRRRGCLTTFAILFTVIVIAIGWFVWQNSDASLPPLAKGLSPKFEEGDKQFKRRIERLYPIGSSEERLKADLRSQGFRVTLRSQGLSEGTLSRVILCGGKEWDVRWYAEAGKLSEVIAVYGATCL